MGKQGVTRRKFLRNSLAIAAGAALPLAGYAQFVEPHQLTVEKLDLRISKLPEAFDGFRIVQLSDFHFGSYTGVVEIAAAVELANSLKPDLVALTGDFITAPAGAILLTDPVFTEAAQCAQALSGLRAPNGIFACLGNHDVGFNSRYITEVLVGSGLWVLVNANRAIERAGKRLWIAGVDDGVFGTPDFSRALAGIPAEEAVILIAHEPDLADEAAKHPISLQLSGHSHGGQIRLPLVNALYLPILAKKYPFGYYRVRDMQLYTNRGIGTIVLPYRLNAPPEVTLVTLKRD